MSNQSLETEDGVVLAKRYTCDYIYAQMDTNFR